MQATILGCGYLGTALATRLRGEGGPVAALTRNQTQADSLQKQGIEPVVCADLAGNEWHGRLNPAGASIIHCVSPSAPSPEGYRHSFLQGTESLVRWLEDSAACGGSPARQLVFTSATSVYPQTDGSWVGEGAAVDEASLSEAGKILRQAENRLLALPPTLVRRVFILRLAGIYGPGRHQLLDKLRAGEEVSVGRHWLNLIHRDDAVGALCAALGAPEGVSGGIFNVADGAPVIQAELVDWLADRLQLPSGALRTSTEPARSSHRRPAGSMAPNRRISSLHLREILGWSPQHPSFREGYESILAGEI